MKYFLFGLLVATSLLFSGCASSAGYRTANHNGKMYFFPENCTRYQYYYSDMDTIYCVDDKGAQTGLTLKPADAQQLANYERNQRASREALDSISRGLQDSAEQMRRNNESLMQMMPKTHYHYHRF